MYNQNNESKELRNDYRTHQTIMTSTNMVIQKRKTERWYQVIMSINSEQSGTPLSKVQEFFQMVYDILKLGYLPENSFLPTDGPDFLFENGDDIEKEAPKTSDLLQTGDFITDLDGYRVWSEQKGKYDQEKYILAVKTDYDEALKLYQEELNTTWTPK